MGLLAEESVGVSPLANIKRPAASTERRSFFRNMDGRAFVKGFPRLHSDRSMKREAGDIWEAVERNGKGKAGRANLPRFRTAWSRGR
jgi:hypothetical protein